MRQPLPSLKWLMTFRTLAHCGSVQITAQQTGQSISTVSYHIQCLEDHLGITLVDHAARPMILTTQGTVYLRYTEDILSLSEQASREIKDVATSNLQRLRFAMIDDFESDIGPEITQFLASILPNCHLSHYTRMSHDILSMFRNRELDIGVATQPQDPLPKAREYPLLRDPFVIAVPASSSVTADACFAGQSGLPFLRYMQTQVIGAQIAAHLNRLRVKLAHKCELDSTSSILALVARGNGWAITTPTNYAHSKRFQSQVRLLPIPRKGFSRTISMFVAEPYLDDLANIVRTALRTQISAQTIAPTVDAFPWLTESFRLFPED